MVDDKKIMRNEALEYCIRELMENEKGKEIKINAMQWKNLAIEAVSEVMFLGLPVYFEGIH
ncbi:hypothetical protein Ahy_A04g017899 [Arachis hypogaea]|uniref:Uncharacterized protein n=1 Tax=Arachis hypogaea TaxID=3818 RepID=A0A445DCG6_ARAHY|nr:hypothetical protein Ahy_A04g017899 [Arachis hypogaea]